MADEGAGTGTRAVGEGGLGIRRTLLVLCCGLMLGAAVVLVALRGRSETVQAATAPTTPDMPGHAAATLEPATGAPAADPVPTADTETSHPDTPDHAPLEEVIARALPAIVSVRAGQNRGTGFFVRPDAVLTNAHVVEGHPFVELETADHRRVPARVTRVSAATDLALIQPQTFVPGQATLALGASSAPRTGQEVVAIGSALGVLSDTATRGIVSAVRPLGSVTLNQTDAAINPGNSGGPLIDRDGIVIGINSMTVASRVGQGLGFAVAVDHARDLLNGRTTAADTTPIQALSQTMSGPAPSDADSARSRGEQDYARVVDWAVRAGEDLDNGWSRTAGACVSRSVTAGSRAWFAVYEPRGVVLSNSSAYNCEAWLASFTGSAERLRGEVARAGEAARQAGVYPGVLRDMRRRARMDWTGWDR